MMVFAGCVFLIAYVVAMIYMAGVIFAGNSFLAGDILVLLIIAMGFTNMIGRGLIGIRKKQLIRQLITMLMLDQKSREKGAGSNE